MRWDNSELITDQASEDLYDSSGERLFAYSPTLYVEDYITISDFVLTPSVTTINAKVNTSVKVTEDLVEGEM